MYLEIFETIERALSRASGVQNPPLTEGGAHADFATTIAFERAKELHRPPVRIAEEIAAALGKDSSLEGISIETKGPYINFSTGPGFLRSSIEAALQPGYGTLSQKEGKVVLEHTSANPNGPLHVGHIRNTIIGDTLARLFRKAGYRVEVQYYVNDMGRQIRHRCTGR